MRAHLAMVISLGLLSGCSADWGQVSGEQLEVARAKQAPTPARTTSSRRTELSAVAAYPDKGSLFAYDKAGQTMRTGEATWHPVRLSEEHALRAAVGGTMVVDGPDGQPIRLAFERRVEHADGNWTWVGRPQGAKPGVEAIVTFGEKAVFGTIPNGRQEPLQIVSVRGRTWLVEADRRVLDRNAAQRQTADYIVPLSLSASPGGSSTSMTALPAMGSAKSASVPAKAAAPATAATTVDVVIGYTTGFAQRLGGTSEALTRLAFVVDLANQAYANSEVSGQLRVVQAIQVDYPDATTNRSALFELSGVSCTSALGGQLPDGGVNCTAVGQPAALRPLITAREHLGADLVTLVRNFDNPASQSCGLGWMLGGGQTPITSGSSAFGMSVVSDSSGSATPNDCRSDALAHETGHNLGLQHDREIAQGSDDTNSDGNLLDPEEFGRQPYSFGFTGGAGAGDFFDVMSIRRAGRVPVLVFSNPRISICGGFPCGVANQADAALSLSFNLPYVAAFRVPTTPIGNTWLRGDLDGDGRDDVIWRNRGTGANLVWRSGASASQQLLTTVASQAWSIAGAGDFDGNGRADILWRNSTSGANLLWNGGNSASVRGLTTVPSPAWTIAGAGDFNGDGNDDILWRNTTSGTNAIWLSGNSTTTQAIAAVPAQTWRIVGVGDFDADNRSDILWRNTSTGQNIIWRSGNSATTTAVAPVGSQTWRVAGVADFDGDGRADILWRNGVSGQNVISRSGNAATPQAVTAVTDVRWAVVAVGDFDNDGKADIYWRNFHTGGNVIWRSANSATPAAQATVNVPSWVVSG